MSEELAALARRFNSATGSDRELGAELARVFGGREPVPDYSASVYRCIDLIHAAMPGWAWHVGWNASGVLPYASLHLGDLLAEAARQPPPLALLKALLRAKVAADD